MSRWSVRTSKPTHTMWPHPGLLGSAPLPPKIWFGLMSFEPDIHWGGLVTEDHPRCQIGDDEPSHTEYLEIKKANNRSPICHASRLAAHGGSLAI